MPYCTLVEPAAPRPELRSSRRRWLRALAGPAALMAAGCASPQAAKRPVLRYVSANMETTPVPTLEPTPEPTPAVMTYVASSAPARKPDHLELPLRLPVPRPGVAGLLVS